MTIRHANIPDDLPALAVLFNEHFLDDRVFKETYEDILPPPNSENIVLCAERDNQLAGVLCGYKTNIGPYKPYMLERLVVHRDFRRAGVATELLLDFTEMLDRRNDSSMLSVECINTGAIRLYNIFGYESEPDLSRNRDEDYTSMWRPPAWGSAL